MQLPPLTLSTQNLAEIQTYVNILQQINQTLPLVPNVSLGTSEVRSLMLSQCPLHVCVCVSLRGEMVFAFVSALASCLELMRLAAPRPDWPPAPAFILFYSLPGRPCAAVRSVFTLTL